MIPHSYDHFQSNFIIQFKGYLREGIFKGIKTMVSFHICPHTNLIIWEKTPLCQASSRGLAAVPGSWVQQREKRDGAQHHLTLLSNWAVTLGRDSSKIIGVI